MPLIETKGAASAQGFGLTLGSSGPVTYIEDVFSTWLYTGNGSTQTITNGIDLAGEGGLVWIKRRVNTGGIGDTYHILTDTLRGANKQLYSNGVDAQATNANMITSFNADGYSIGSDGNVNFSNASPQTYVSWTFRKQAKFFDVVTWTGNGVNERVISHSLGSDIGAIIVKRTDTTSNWQFVINVGGGSTRVLRLNTTEAAYPTTANMLDNGYASINGFYTPSNTGFALINGSTDFSQVNANGGTYVAYLFAHNAGGFGLTGTDNVISCGSFTTDGSGFVPDVNLGYEPQWILLKQTSSTNSWFMFDNMRGWSQTNSQYLYANSSMAEATWNSDASQYFGVITPTGFKGLVSSGINNGTFIYIAIRRGPMKVPTSGTSVYANFYSNYSAGTILTSNFPVDLSIWKGNTVWDWSWDDRLRGTSTAVDTGKASLASNSVAAENNGWAYLGAAKFDNNTGVSVSYKADSSRSNQASYALLRRAPGFFDEVCYTGDGVNGRAVPHNLGVVPEMMIVKSRSGPTSWFVYTAPTGNTKWLILQNNSAATDPAGSGAWNDTTPTASNFYLGTGGNVNDASMTFVAYLFATCAGVSKVGSYTGTGALQTVNCGFTGGSRFVLIKRTDSTGDWYVYDSARGISSGNDPYLFLNTTAAEVTGTNYVDTTSVGFQVTAAAPAGLNANGGTYIFLAIA